jgi:hypothetical protein
VFALKLCENRIKVMLRRSVTTLAVLLLGAIALQGTSAHALSMHECSVKYRAAKEAGTLNGMKWNEFRKTQCENEATAAPPPPGAQRARAAPKPFSEPAAFGNAVFPNAISPQYSGESAGRARRATCLDQYRANKANNANGGLRWIQKGGGYYSECNKRLKGQA